MCTSTGVGWMDPQPLWFSKALLGSERGVWFGFIITAGSTEVSEWFLKI